MSSLCTTEFDVFFSHRRKDLERAQPLLEALGKAEVRVWRDETDLPDYAEITPEIRRALAASKVLLAFYSTNYPDSRPCQQEIIAAWLGAQRTGEPPYRRVLVINPEANFDHIPAVLREQQSMRCEGAAELAAKIRHHVESLSAGSKSDLPPAAYHGMSAVEAPRFVGRVRELWELHGRLTANRMSIITGVFGQAAAQVRGLPGNGKSLLAREYAIRFGAAYLGGVFWLNAYGNDDTRGPLDTAARDVLRQDQIQSFALRLNVVTDGRTPGEIEAAFWRRLEEKGEQCLWIVDDLPAGLEMEQVEKCWHAQWAGAATLITTRSAEYGAMGSHLDLEVLCETEASQLLTGHRNPQTAAEEEAAKDIVAELGFHPLAIEVAGSYLAKRIQSFAEYLTELRDPDRDAVEFGAELRESLPTGHERSISGTFLKSIRLLGEEGRDFLRLASLLAVAPIPVKLVEGAFAVHASEAQARTRLLRALDQADSLSLCAMAGDNARSVHTLVSRTIRCHSGLDEQTNQLRLAVTRALDRRLMEAKDIRRHSEVARDVVHARHILSAGISTLEEAALGGRLAGYHFDRGEYPGARKLYEGVLEAVRRLEGEEHVDALAARNNLAQILFAQGELAEARKLQAEVLEARRRLLGENHPSTRTVRQNLAHTLLAQGELEEARKLRERVTLDSLHLLLSSDAAALQSMAGLALMAYAEGKLPEARNLQELVLEGSRRLSDEEDPSTLDAMLALASTLYRQGDLTGARKLAEQVLERGVRVLPETHPLRLQAGHNLSKVLLAQGDVTGARNLLEEVLKASRKMLGAEHPDSLTIMTSLAAILHAQGELAGARELQEQVLDASRRLRGEEHPETLTAIANLAATAHSQGDPAAPEMFRRVLEAERRALGAQHPSTSLTAWNLCWILQQSGDFESAREVVERDLQWLLDRDPATLDSYQRQIRENIAGMPCG